MLIEIGLNHIFCGLFFSALINSIVTQNSSGDLSENHKNSKGFSRLTLLLFHSFFLDNVLEHDF